MPEPSLDVLARAKRGDPQAFQELIRPHLPSIRRFAFSFARHWDDADDLAQEALLKAFRSIHSFEERSNLSTWLYAVTRSVGLDQYRGRLARERRREDALSDSIQDERDSQHSLYCSKTESLALWSAIKTLDEEFRTAVVLFDIEGLSYEEIAAVEGIPVGTVRSRLSRGRAKLKQILVERLSPPGATTGEPQDRRAGGVR